MLAQAHAWICQQRREYSPNSDVWDLRWRWDEIRPRLQRELLAGTYRFGAVRHRCVRGELIELWSAEDAIVLKAVALVLTEEWAPRLSPRCHHLPGNGGVKGALREVRDGIPGHRFVFRTDVKEYYAHIDHERLYAQLERWTDDRQVLRLLWGCLHRSVEKGGIYRTIRRGISRGCPLSPLFGALYLNELDERMAATGLGYARFMDDWVILAPTRWKLRTAIKRVHRTMAELGLTLHSDKTSVGRTERGFDFLGYRLGGARVEVARPAVERMAERVTRLYEQGASERRIGDYVRRWLGWVNGGWKSENDENHHEPRARVGGEGETDGERKVRVGGRDSQRNHKNRGLELGGESGCHVGEGNALMRFIRPPSLDEPPQPPKPSPCHDDPTWPPDASRTFGIPELVQKPLLRRGCRGFASSPRPSS